MRAYARALCLNRGIEMTIEQAHKELDKQYQKARKLGFVNSTVAWALYQTWQKAEEIRRKKEKRSE